MGAKSKASNKAQELKGQVTETVGRPPATKTCEPRQDDQTKAFLKRCGREGQGGLRRTSWTTCTQVVGSDRSGKELGQLVDEEWKGQEADEERLERFIVGALTGTVGGQPRTRRLAPGARRPELRAGVIGTRLPPLRRPRLTSTADTLRETGGRAASWGSGAGR